MKTLSILFLTLAALLAGAPVTHADIISATLHFTRTQDMIHKADQAVQNGDYHVALPLYKFALTSFTQLMAEDPDFQPDMIESQMEYCDGRIDALLGSLDQSEDPETSQAPPDNTAATTPSSEAVAELLALARDHLEAGDAGAARAKILEGFKLDPDNIDLRLLAGLAQCQARRFSDAIFLLSELAIEAPSSARIRIGLAAAYFGDGQREAAIKELEAAISMEPTLSEGHYNLAQMMLTGPEPDHDAASKAYQQALKLGATPDPRLEAALSKP